MSDKHKIEDESRSTKKIRVTGSRREIMIKKIYRKKS
jgi:hypothetical protein